MQQVTAVALEGGHGELAGQAEDLLDVLGEVVRARAVQGTGAEDDAVKGLTGRLPLPRRVTLP